MCVEGILSLCMLGIKSIWDIRKREILFLPTLTFGIAGGIYRIGYRKECALLLLSLLPGLLLLILALSLPEQIGAGDAWTVLAVGAWTAPEEGLVWLCISMFAAAVAAGVLFLQKKRKRTLPFVPFLLAGRLLQLFLL